MIDSLSDWSYWDADHKGFLTAQEYFDYILELEGRDVAIKRLKEWIEMSHGHPKNQ